MLITNPRWRTAAILKKIEKSPYLGNGLTGRHEIFQNDAQLTLWKIAAIFKPLNSHNPGAVGQIAMKFGMITHFDPIY